MTRWRILGWMAATLLMLTGLVLGIKHYRRFVLWDNFGEVEPGRIYRSGRLQPHQLRTVASEYQLRSILNLSHQRTQGEGQLARELGLQYFKANWPGDGVVDEARLQWAYEVICRPENQPILIHCERGTSRTGAVVGYYRMRSNQWSRAQVRDEMKVYRHTPHRNLGLEALLDQLFLVHHARTVGVQEPGDLSSLTDRIGAPGMPCGGAAADVSLENDQHRQR